MTTPKDSSRGKFALSADRSVKNLRANHPVAVLPASSLVVRAVPHWQVPSEVVGEGDNTYMDMYNALLENKNTLQLACFFIQDSDRLLANRPTSWR